MRRVLITLLLFLSPLAAQAQRPLVVAHWVQLGPDGAVEARAVVDGDSCPEIYADQKAVSMQVRATGNGSFPLVCSVQIPRGAKSVLQAVWEMTPGDESPGRKVVEVKLPPADPQRILVFGDTGCRIKGKKLQDCSDPEKWPFRQIAAEAAKLKPDLVIHVGDYLYREKACPEGTKGCAGTPFGDNWPTWDADFFAPGAPLLAAAPWVFVRGNHEDCARAGSGWLRLLGPSAYDANTPCAAHLAPYSVPLGAMNLVVMDDADAPETSVVSDMVPVYRQEFASLATTKAPSWLLLHRPVWAAISGPLGIPIGGNQTLIEAIGTSGIPSPVALMLSGHIHTFEAINYGKNDHVPPQVVAGFGGDDLDPTPAILKGTIFQGHSGVVAKDGLSLPGFGFLLMTKTAKGWQIDVHDMHGRIERQCLFADGRVDCPMGR